MTPENASTAIQRPAKDESSRLLPREPPRSKDRSVLLQVCLPILVLEFSLWVATATLTSSVPIYLRKHLGVDSVHATEVNYALQTLSNLAPIGGGIVLACITLTTGLTICTIAAHPAVTSARLLCVGLFGGVAVAQGGTAPYLVVLGADQFDASVASQQIEKQSFFNWFYWSINVGGFVSCAFLSNLAVSGFAPLVSEEAGFFAAFGVATLVFAVGSLVFYSGKQRYHRRPPSGSVLTDFLGLLVRVCAQSARGKFVLSALAAFVPGIVLTTASYFVDASSSLHMSLALTGAGAVAYGLVGLIATCHSTAWVSSASCPRLREVGLVLRLLPYMSVIVLFWATYSQMETNFVLQGCQMNLRVPGRDMVSSATLTIVDSTVILLFIPFFDRVVYPALSYPTLMRKIGAGLFFSLAAMVCAALVETYRKSSGLMETIGSNCADESKAKRLPMSQLSVGWQTLQYLLIGMSEILTSVTAYDLFYTEVPESMRSACQSLNLLTTTLGYIVAGAVNSIFSDWITSDLNEGKLENIFLIMAMLVAASITVFLAVSRSFQYLDSSDAGNDIPAVIA